LKSKVRTVIVFMMSAAIDLAWSCSIAWELTAMPSIESGDGIMILERALFGRDPLLAWRLSVYLSICLSLGLAAAQPAPAQPAPAQPAPAHPAESAGPSASAPGDLTKPAFDTTKPVFDSIPGMDKSSAAVVAEVEGRAITLGEVGDIIRSYPPAMAQYSFDVLYPSVLDQLIHLQATVLRAQNQGLDDDPVVRRRTREAASRVLADEYVRREAEKEITEAMLLERYKQDIEGKPGAEQVHVRVIMVPEEKEADALIQELKGGADFATLAHRSSKDTTAQNGGDLGFVTRGGLNAEVGSVAFATPAGQLVPFPVLSVGGWFIIRVDERRRQPTPPFATAREQLHQALLGEAEAKLTAAVTEGFQVRRFDLMGRDIGQDDHPAPDK
jgi:peptidyl-prolyl cis-trans isomerase C